MSRRSVRSVQQMRTSCSKRVTDHGESCKEVSQVELLKSKHPPSGKEAKQYDQHTHAIFYPYFCEQSMYRWRGHSHLANASPSMPVAMFDVR